MKQTVIHHLFELLKWVNDCPDASFNPIYVHKKAVETSKAISLFKKGAELVDAGSSTLCTLLGGLMFKSKTFELVVPNPGKGIGQPSIGCQEG
jgi:hypothetical protein